MSYARNRILAIQVRYNVTGNRLTTTMHYGCNTAVGIDDCNELRQAWQTAVQPKLEALLSEDVHFDSIYCWADEPGVALPYVDQLTSVVGLVSGEAIPENLAAVFQLKQYETNSKANGRLLLSGISEADVVNSLVDPSSLAAQFQDFADALMLPLTTSGPKTWKLVTVSRWLAGVKRTPPLGFEIAAVIPTRSLATQRRRQTELSYVNP